MPTANNEELSQDVIFQLLSSDRRRFVLKYLSDTPGEVKLDELSTAMAAHENGIEPAAVDQTAQKRAYISLYQTHIPRMTEHGIVEYDSDSGDVRLTPKADRMLSYLNDGSEPGRPWPELYLATTAIGIVLLLLQEVGGIQLTSPTVLASILFLVVFAIAIAHYVSVRAPVGILD